MHAMNDTATSPRNLDLGFLAEKSNGTKKHRRNFGLVDDDGNQRTRSPLDTKRAARQQVVYQETEMDLRAARMGFTSFDDDGDHHLD